MRIETTGGVQWNGIAISPRQIGLQPGGVYEFYVELYTPSQKVGLMVQTNGIWRHIIHTQVFDPKERGWHGFNDILDLNDIHGDLPFDQIQIVKLGNASGGVNDHLDIIFFMRNFAMKEGGNEIFCRDFSNATRPFLQSGSDINLVSDPHVPTLLYSRRPNIIKSMDMRP